MSNSEIQVAFGDKLLVLPASAGSAPPLKPGDTGGLCFRPEHFRPTAGEGEQRECVELGELVVLDHAFFGTHLRCQVQWLGADQPIPLIVNLPQSFPGVSVGQHFPLTVLRDSIVLILK